MVRKRSKQLDIGVLTRSVGPTNSTIYTLFHEYCAARRRKVEWRAKVRRGRQNKVVRTITGEHVGRGKACVPKNKSRGRSILKIP